MIKRASISFKLIAAFLILTFIATFSLAQLSKTNDVYAKPSSVVLPQGVLSLTEAYSLPLLKGIKFDPKEPLSFEFIVDNADKGNFDQEEFEKLVSYFLVGLTVAEEDLWVNLSPYEEGRILPQALSQTELGKDILAQDYILKQLSASLTHPETDLGKAYWDKFSIIDSRLSAENVDFSKIWIVPETAEVYEKDGLAVIKKSALKVLSESDYLALSKTGQGQIEEKDNDKLEILLPKISKEVNQGKHFAKLRQVYSALILSTWFKQKVRDSFYSNYINQNKVEGQQIADLKFKEETYLKYLQSVKKGVYDLIKKEDFGQQKIKRKYFCGGNSYGNLPKVLKQSSSIDAEDKKTVGPVSSAKVDLSPVEEDEDLRVIREHGSIVVDKSKIIWPQWKEDCDLDELESYFSKTAHAAWQVFKEYKMEDRLLEGNLSLDLGEFLASELREKFSAYLEWLQLMRDRSSTYSDVVEFKKAKKFMKRAYRLLKVSAARQSLYKKLDASIIEKLKSRTPLTREEAAVYVKYLAFWKDPKAAENFKQYQDIVSKITMVKERVEELEKELFIKVNKELKITDESKYHPYAQWLKIDEHGETTAAAIMYAYLPRMTYDGSSSWENNIDFKRVINLAKQMGMTGIKLLPIGARSQYDDRKNKENAKEYAAQVDDYIRRKKLGEDVSFDFIRDDSPYSMLSFYSFDRRNVVLSDVDIEGESLIEKFNNYKSGDDYLDIFKTMANSEEVRDFADTMAIRALKDARPEYLDFILEHFPGYRASDFVDMPYPRFRSMEIYYKLKDLVFFEQYWAQKQFAENVKYAHEQGIKVILDIPAFPAVNGVESISNPRMIRTDDNGGVINPGVNGQTWNSLSDLDRNGYLKRNKFKPLIDIYDWWKTKFGIDGFRGDAWHFSKGVEGNWEAVTEYMRENNLLFLVETAGAFDAPQINPYSRTLGGINEEVGWENEGQGRIDTLENVIYGEHGLRENMYVTTMMTPAGHDFLPIPEKYRNVFGGTQDNKIITQGMLGLFAMASNTFSFSLGDVFASNRPINANPGQDGLWEGGLEENIIDLTEYIARLTQIRKDYPYLLNPNNMAISIIAPGVVQVERYSKRGRQAIVSIHNISAETKEGNFSVSYDHFKLDPNKDFSLQDLMHEKETRYKFSKSNGSVNENGAMYYKLEPGQMHVFELGQNSDYKQKQSSSVDANPHSLADDRGFGKMDLSKERLDFAGDIANEFIAVGFDVNQALVIAETVASLKLASIRKRQEFFHGIDSFVLAGRRGNEGEHKYRLYKEELKKKISQLIKQYYEEHKKYKNAKGKTGKNLFSEVEIDRLLDQNLIPFSWYTKLTKNVDKNEPLLSHEQAVDLLIEETNPVNQWKITFRFSLAKPESLGIDRANTIKLVLLFKHDFVKKWNILRLLLNAIKISSSNEFETGHQYAAEKFIEWIDILSNGDKKAKHDIAMDFVDNYSKSLFLTKNENEALIDTIQEFGLDKLKITGFASQDSELEKQEVNSSPVFSIPALALEGAEDIFFEKSQSTDNFYIYLNKNEMEEGKSVGKIKFRNIGNDRYIDELTIGNNNEELSEVETSIFLSIVHKMLDGAYSQGRFEFKLPHSHLTKYYEVLSRFEVLRKAKVEYGEYGEGFRGEYTGYQEIGQYDSLHEALENIAEEQHIIIRVDKVEKVERPLKVTGNMYLLEELVEKFSSPIKQDFYAQRFGSYYLSDAITAEKYLTNLWKIYQRTELEVDSSVADLSNVRTLNTIIMGEHEESIDLIKNFLRSLTVTVYPYLSKDGYDNKEIMKIRNKIDEFGYLLMNQKAFKDMSIHEVDELLVASLRGIIGEDPYRGLKEDAHNRAMLFLQDLLEREKRGEKNIDLDTAIRLSAVGNSMDFANLAFAEKLGHGGFDLDYFYEELDAIEYSKHDEEIFKVLMKNDPLNIVFAMDNVGEDVLDLPLLRELVKKGANVTIAVKSRPAVNDTTYDDAKKLFEDKRVKDFFAGLDMNKIKIVPSGSISYGLDVARISPQLKESWVEADFIIAKGQANYYTLKNVAPTVPVFFLGKCKVAVEMFDEYEEGDYFLEYMPVKVDAYKELYKIFDQAILAMYDAAGILQSINAGYVEEEHEESLRDEAVVGAVKAVKKLVSDLKKHNYSKDKLMQLFYGTLYGGINYQTDSGYEFDATFDIPNTVGKIISFADLYEMNPEKFLVKIQELLNESVFTVLGTLLDILENYPEDTYDQLKKDQLITKSTYAGKEYDVINMREFQEKFYGKDKEEQKETQSSNVQGGMDFKDMKVSSSGISVPLELRDLDFTNFKGFTFTVYEHNDYRNLDTYLSYL